MEWGRERGKAIPLNLTLLGKQLLILPMWDVGGPNPVGFIFHWLGGCAGPEQGSDTQEEKTVPSTNGASIMCQTGDTIVGKTDVTPALMEFTGFPWTIVGEKSNHGPRPQLTKAPASSGLRGNVSPTWRLKVCKIWCLSSRTCQQKGKVSIRRLLKRHNH